MAIYGHICPKIEVYVPKIQISKIIKDEIDIFINPSMIQPVNDIKSLGNYKVILNLHSEVQTNINIKVISTSEIKISVLIDKKNTKKALLALHNEFQLED